MVEVSKQRHGLADSFPYLVGPAKQTCSLRHVLVDEGPLLLIPDAGQLLLHDELGCVQLFVQHVHQDRVLALEVSGDQWPLQKPGHHKDDLADKQYITCFNLCKRM